MTTLMAAHAQWANRPADETFSSVADLHAKCMQYRTESRSATVAMSDLRVEANGEEVQLVGKQGQPALLTSWSFGQLCQRAGAPASYVRELPPTLAAQNLNYGLAHAPEAQGAQTKLLFRQNGDFRLRCAVTDSYTRIWNSDVTERLMALQAAQPSWKLPLAYNRQNLGGPMVPRGAYASDRDMFCFLTDEDHPIALEGSEHPLKRGFFVWNSEVGAASLGITTFLYDYVCGNHYVWGAQKVREIRVRHTGDADRLGWAKVAASVRAFANSSAREDEQRVIAARGMLLGASKDEAIDAVLARRIPELSRKRVTAAYEVAEGTPRYGNPRSVWGIASGLTEIAQEAKNTDDRTQMDRAAGKLLEIAF